VPGNSLPGSLSGVHAASTGGKQEKTCHCDNAATAFDAHQADELDSVGLSCKLQAIAAKFEREISFEAAGTVPLQRMACSTTSRGSAVPQL
jgi:hypothetical protein